MNQKKKNIIVIKANIVFAQSRFLGHLESMRTALCVRDRSALSRKTRGKTTNDDNIVRRHQLITIFDFLFDIHFLLY